MALVEIPYTDWNHSSRMFGPVLFWDGHAFGIEASELQIRQIRPKLDLRPLAAYSCCPQTIGLGENMLGKLAAF